MLPFYLAILAHVCVDFLFQPERMIRNRRKGRLGTYFVHGGIAALASFLAMQFFSLRTAGIFALSVALSHLVMDWCKDRLSQRRAPEVGLAAFLADQALHLAVILVLWQELSFNLDERVLGFYRALIPGRTATANALFLPIQADASMNRVLLACAVYIAVLFGGAVLLRLFLDALQISPRPERSSSQGRVGKYIGILERGLLLTMVLAGVPSAAGFVIAAKSVARFRELEDKNFAEYYLVGTLASTLLAVGAGFWLRGVLVSP